MYSRKILLGLAPETVLEIRQYRADLLSLKSEFDAYLNQSLKAMHFAHLENPLLVDGFYESLVGGYYQDAFYIVQYQQALQYYGKNYSLKDVAIIMDRVTQFLVEKSQAYSPLLPSAFKDVLALSFDIFSHIFELFASIERMKQQSSAVIKRIETAYQALSIEIPQDLLTAYRNHQRWKVEVFNLSLGRALTWEDFEISPEFCALAKWLEAGGESKIPPEQLEEFLNAHDLVHFYGRKAIKHAQLQQSEAIIDFLQEMEVASDFVNHVLLELIDQEMLKRLKQH